MILKCKNIWIQRKNSTEASSAKSAHSAEWSLLFVIRLLLQMHLNVGTGGGGDIFNCFIYFWVG